MQFPSEHNQPLLIYQKKFLFTLQFPHEHNLPLLIPQMKLLKVHQKCLKHHQILLNIHRSHEIHWPDGKIQAPKIIKSDSFRALKFSRFESFFGPKMYVPCPMNLVSVNILFTPLFKLLFTQHYSTHFDQIQPWQEVQTGIQQYQTN